MSAYSQVLRLYNAYVDTYRAANGALPEMMQLKRTHTAFVVKNAELIADGESFDATTREVAVIAALLHDTGRYEQLKRYNTFKDSESVDHAVFSHDIVVREGWLDQARGEEKAKARGEGEEKAKARGEGEVWKDAILKAVLYHNRRDLPEEIRLPPSPSPVPVASLPPSPSPVPFASLPPSPSPVPFASLPPSPSPSPFVSSSYTYTSNLHLHLLSLASHTVRDADKLDIFRVLEERLGNPAWRNDTRAFWNLKIEAAPNPEVVRAIEERRPVDYNAIRSLADFVLIQIGWMVSGLFFATSRRLCRERGHLAFRRAFLHTLTDDPSIDRLCTLADETL